ncbi:hypothetical protein JI749_08330 [Devosia oryziradicis]|uniref:Secreted protein n=1 Tax=Devosia oryziradicis TaxID=2801335 RepID=A0ABX7C2Z0_9HYPH|nr:hypothetical protein [Devosia oryziradicis]QQR37599.1 hypothetical protein JI749_08330 [Devosia oryziradicis]
MHIKTIVSAVALSAAVTFGGVAYAQDAALPTMIGEQQLTAADAQRVKTYCEDLQKADTQAADAAASDADSDANTAMTSEESEGEEGDAAAAGSVDMDLITVEACTEAGFITAP